jgi:hypothetical protein
MTALRPLLESLIDYAGLFPPAALPMPKAVENYARYHESPEAWMLAKFVVPVARLDEFEECAAGAQFLLSVLASGDLVSDLARISRSRTPIDAIELKASDEAQIESPMRLIPANITAYFEISKLSLLPSIAAAGARAKIRTGGITPEAFPDAGFVAQFLAACAKAGVAFKATAGLHHALRCFRPLTYSADGPSGWMFGFLNVILAAELARDGKPAAELEPVLLAETIEKTRCFAEKLRQKRGFLVSVGSCSFEEPVADLRALNLL